MLNLLSALQGCPAAHHLGPAHKPLLADLWRFGSSVASGNFEWDRVKPLLVTILTNKPDEEIWNQVYHAVTESTPPPRPVASSIQQTPSSRNMGGIVNSSELRKDTDNMLKVDLGPMYVDIPGFHDAILGGIRGLGEASDAVFEKCCEGPDPLFRHGEGWSGWSEGAQEGAVQRWLDDLVQKFIEWAPHHEAYEAAAPIRRLVAEPHKPLGGSMAKRKLDVGIVSHPGAIKHWSQILVPGELKSNPKWDSQPLAWTDIGRYVREVLANQDTRRFVLAFTLCGPLMRVWEFDRLGPIASTPFNINENGPQFVSTILGFLWASEEQLGFDPTVITSDNQRYIEIERDGASERLVIDQVMLRTPCVGGRATTCWKAHPEQSPSTALVIKDSWQDSRRGEEGRLFREVSDKDVRHVARYYYYETVHLPDGRRDDVQGGIRKGLDIEKASNYLQERLTAPEGLDTLSISQDSSTGQKRSSSQTGAAIPPPKRSRSTSPIKPGNVSMPSNRVHRRVVLRDYGKPIYEASSPAALLAAFEACITGHESLYRAGFLHRDISINNLLITESKDSPLYPAFLIDLDLAIANDRIKSSGARGKTGTRAFMAIGILLGEQHSFMHDLESFFWVLFWICVHYEGPGKDITDTECESWNYESDNKLAYTKNGTISDEELFLKFVKRNFTPYYKLLVPWVNKLRRAVFPNGISRKREDKALYSQMRQILCDAQKDPRIVSEQTSSGKTGG